MDLQAMTPPEIDTILAELYRDESNARVRIESDVTHLHYCLGEKKKTTGRGRSRVESWPTTDAEAEKKLRGLVDLEDCPLMPWEVSKARTYLKRLDDDRAKLDEILAKAAPYQAEYRRRPWPRFYLVTGGHIHESKRCSTCWPTTDFTWLCELSGCTEKEAVDEYGPLLCTVCYPSAPPEWKVGPEKPAVCSGAGLPGKEGSDRQYGPRSFYATCTGCGDEKRTNTYGRIFKHPPKEEPAPVPVPAQAAELKPGMRVWVEYDGEGRVDELGEDTVDVVMSDGHLVSPALESVRPL